MYRYLSRVSRQRHKDSVKIGRGHEIVQKNDGARVQSTQAFSDLRDFCLFGRTNNSRSHDAQIQIINALRLGQRHKAHEMLVDFSCMNGSSNAEDFDYILEYCAQTPDPLFVMEAWKVMVKNEIDMKKKSYRCIIQAFSKGGYFKEAFEWITSLEESGHFHAGLPLCNIVLRECIYKQSMIDIGRCLELMDNQLMGRSEITYWELLKHSVLQKSLPAVHGLWKDCIKHYSPSIIILRKFIWSFTRLHDLESAYKVLQYMVSLAKSGCTSLRKSAAGRYQSSRLDIPVPPACKLSNEGFRLKEDLPLQTMFTAKSVKEEDGFMTLDIPGIAGCSSNNVADVFLTDGDTADACFVLNTADTVFSGIHGSNFFGEAKEKDTCSKISSSVAAGINNRYLLVKNEEVIKHTTNCSQKKKINYSIPKEEEFIPVVNVMRWSFNDVIQYCAQSGTWELAEFLFLQMQALGIEPSPHTYDGLIKAITHGRALAYGLELIHSMERRGMKPYNDTIAILSVEHSKILELNKAECLLEMISDNLQKYIHPFNAFLVACDIMDEPERAVRILVKMKCLNIRLNIRTFELLFSLFGNVNAPYERGNWPSRMHAAERIRHIEIGMTRSGVQHSNTSMKNLIRALGMEGMIAEMLQRLEKAKIMLLEMEPHQITDLYNIVLRALVEAGHGLTAIEYFQRMRSYGLLTDAATYHIMIECCSLITCFRSALALTSLMLRDGFFPQIMTYTALVKVLLANDDFHGALHIFNQASSDKIQLDVHLFNEILQQAYTKISSEEVEEENAEGLIDVIEIIIEQMRRDKVKPDPSTCTYAFCAYTELDFHSTAVEALRVLSLRMISENDDDLHEKRTRFADLVCGEDPDIELKIVSIFKGGDEYLATGLLNLRWCTFMAGDQLSWSPEESLWAQRLSSSYFSRRDSVRFLS